MNGLSLQIQGLHLHQGNTRILQGVDLEVRAGERLALIGPNGAGKSTLFHAISGQLPWVQGDVVLGGTSLRGKPVHAIRRLGVSRSFQTSQLFAHLSVLDNLRCAVLADLGHSWNFWQVMQGQVAVNAHAHQVLQALGLADVADCPVADLGYAQQRALELGMALGPKVHTLLLDEPTAGMSRAETEAFMQTIGRVCAGKTLLMVEHDMEVVFSLAERIAVLVDGRVLAVDTPQAIRANPLVQQAYLGPLEAMPC